MYGKIIFTIIVLWSSMSFYGQDKGNKIDLGFAYGFGNQLKNTDYTFTNSYYKLQVYYTIKKYKSLKYEVMLQPELNFATHQLLNFYFVEPDNPDYVAKREKYTKLKDIKECILNIGLLVRKPIFKSASI
ncbi:hypothetical protein [Flavobacterium sp. LB2R40]|uniref:hypothetical protein n=1 Tax=Flavobacterium sp. LB2R40 TaxID=3401722 RepID=UPI003AADA12D